VAGEDRGGERRRPDAGEDRGDGGRGGKVEFDEAESREGAAWLAKIEEENAGELTPEKIAKMEHEAAEKGESDRVLLDENASPTAGRRFTRA
jgi:(E)-4-hydroxy-3-methylbut-2-enyl-diphosphate synthase